MAYGLTNMGSAVKAVAYGLRWSPAIADDLTCKDWPFTGHQVRRWTTIASTWNKTHVRTHDNGIYTLVTVLYQREA